MANFKLDIHSRQEIARTVWNMFIHNIEKLKVHYGKRHIFVVIQLSEDIEADDVTEAHMTHRTDGYSELRNVPMRRDNG